MSSEIVPVIVNGKVYDGIANERLVEALPFLETTKSDLLEATESHEQGVQNVKGSFKFIIITD